MTFVKKAKQALNLALGKFGYEIQRRGNYKVERRNFENLTAAYEHRLGLNGVSLPSSARRPELLARLLGTPPSEAYFIVEALARCASVAGDVCEFGVAQGETSALIANEISESSKRLHLFDSFQGLPKPGDMDELKDDIFSLGSMAEYEGKMSCVEDMVLVRLAAISFPVDRYTLHKGYIESEASLEISLPNNVCFAYIDFDFYEPIKIVLNCVHRSLPIGGIMIVDDYDFFSTGVKKAVDEFCARHNSGNQAIYELAIPDVVLGHFAVLTRVG